MKQLKDNPALQAALHHLQCYRGEVALDSRRTNDLTDIDQVIAGFKAEMQRSQEDLIADLIENAAVSVDISTSDEDFDARIYGRVTEVMTVAGGSAELTILVSPDEPVPSTASSHWKVNGEPDPHGDFYNCERAGLTLGSLTDDELANEAFLKYDVRPSVEDLMANKAHLPIVYMTAIKERIRWLSRRLEEATQKINSVEITLDPLEIDGYADATQIRLKIDNQQFDINDWYENKDQAKLIEKSLRQALIRYAATFKAPEDLGERMRAAGMFSVDELLAGTSLDKWVSNTGVKDLTSFGEWIKVRRREMLSMQGDMELKGEKDNELYDWVIAHAAVFTEAHINFRKVLNNNHVTVTTNESNEVVAVSLQDEEHRIIKTIWQKDQANLLSNEEIKQLTELDQFKVCKNWQKILNQYIPLFGSDWKDRLGETWNFFGLVHADDDYYYGMMKDDRIELLSCVGNIESFGYSKVERPDKTKRPRLKVVK